VDDVDIKRVADEIHVIVVPRADVPLAALNDPRLWRPAKPVSLNDD
jgi:hypothetical protein